jgi:hypothetical protein
VFGNGSGQSQNRRRTLEGATVSRATISIVTVTLDAIILERSVDADAMYVATYVSSH